MTVPKQIHVVQYCSSGGMNCGIATYTEFLSQAQGMPMVSTVEEVDTMPCTHLHVQHEFGMMSLRELRRVHRYCKRRGIQLVITMHTVIPQPSFFVYIAHRFFGVQRQKGVPTVLWHWSKQNPDYGLLAYIHFRRAQRYICKHATDIVVHNEHAKRALYNIGASAVTVVPHGIKQFPVSNHLLSAQDGKLHVGCFGHVNPNRGILDIIHACSQVQNVHVHIHASADMTMTDAHHVYLQEVYDLCEGKDWVTLDTSHASLDDIVFQLSQYDVNVWYCNPPGGISASGSVCQYIAAKRPIIASETVMVADLAAVATFVPPATPDLLAEAIRNHSTDTSGFDALCTERDWKYAHPMYRTQQLFPSLRNHCYYHDTKKQQQEELEESIDILSELFDGDVPLAEFDPNFLRDPLAAYVHQYDNGVAKHEPLDKTILFMHLQKTGGNVLSHIMRANVRSVGMRLDFTKQPNINPAFLLDAYKELPSHRKQEERQKWSKYDVISGYFGYGMHDLIEGPYEYITIMRDPVARFVQYYNSLRHQPEVSWVGSQTYGERARDMSLMEFLEDPFFRKMTLLGHSSTQMIAGTRDTELTDAHLQQAKRNLRSCSAVLLTDEFERSLQMLKKLYGWRPEIYDAKHNPVWNGSRAELLMGSIAIREGISPQEIRAIEEFLHLDMELYTYAEEVFMEQYNKAMQQELLTSPSDKITLTGVSNEVDNSPQKTPSIFSRIAMYVRCILRAPIHLAKLAEYGGHLRDTVRDAKIDQIPNQLNQLSTLIELVQKKTVSDTHALETNTANMNARLDTIVQRLGDIRDIPNRLMDLRNISSQLSTLIRSFEDTKQLDTSTLEQRVEGMASRIDRVADSLIELQSVPGHLSALITAVEHKQVPDVAVVTDRIVDMHTRLDTIIDRLTDLQRGPDRLEGMEAKFGTLADRANDMASRINNIAYNMNEVIASLEAIADLTANKLKNQPHQTMQHMNAPQSQGVQQQ